MDLEIRDPVFFSVRHRGPDVAKYQRKLKNSNFPHVFSQCERAGASRRGNIYSGSLKVKDVGSFS